MSSIHYTIFWVISKLFCYTASSASQHGLGCNVYNDELTDEYYGTWAEGQTAGAMDGPNHFVYCACKNGEATVS